MSVLLKYFVNNVIVDLPCICIVVIIIYFLDCNLFNNFFQLKLLTHCLVCAVTILLVAATPVYVACNKSIMYLLFIKKILIKCIIGRCYIITEKKSSSLIFPYCCSPGSS